MLTIVNCKALNFTGQFYKNKIIQQAHNIFIKLSQVFGTTQQCLHHAIDRLQVMSCFGNSQSGRPCCQTTDHIYKNGFTK